MRIIAAIIIIIIIIIIVIIIIIIINFPVELAVLARAPGGWGLRPPGPHMYIWASEDNADRHRIAEMHLGPRQESNPAKLVTTGPPIKSLDFRGFDSSRLLILRRGNSHVRWIL